MIDIEVAQNTVKSVKEGKKQDSQRNKKAFEDSCLALFSQWNLERKIDQYILNQSNQGYNYFTITVDLDPDSYSFKIIVGPYVAKVDITSLISNYLSINISRPFNSSIESVFLYNSTLEAKKTICRKAFDYIYYEVLKPYKKAGYTVKYDNNTSDYIHSCSIKW